MLTQQKVRILIVSAAVIMSAISPAFAVKPKYAADVPDFLLTPDKVETKFLGGRLKLWNVNSNIYKVFKITQLTKVFDISQM